MISFNIAGIEDLERINSLFEECKKDMIERGIFQWDDFFPSKNYYENAIKYDCLYILKDEDKILGSFIFSESQEPAWEKIKWNKNDDKFLVLHAIAVHPDYQRKGYGQRIMDFCEGLVLSYEYAGIRLDTFSGNKPSLALFDKLGYSRMGEIDYPFKAEGYQRYLCYEKILEL